MATQRTVLTRTPKTSDIEIHVSTLQPESGGIYAEVREYIVSLDQYGRGVTFPAKAETVEALVNGLQKAQVST